MIVAHSHSALTVFELRYGPVLKHETNQQRVKRFAHTYGLSDTEVKLIMAADDELIDSYGRIVE